MAWGMIWTPCSPRIGLMTEQLAIPGVCQVVVGPIDGARSGHPARSIRGHAHLSVCGENNPLAELDAHVFVDEYDHIGAASFEANYVQGNVTATCWPNDIVDTGHPALLRMWDKCQRGYKALAYCVEKIAAISLHRNRKGVIR